MEMLVLNNKTIFPPFSFSSWFPFSILKTHVQLLPEESKLKEQNELSKWNRQRCEARGKGEESK
jgi:hypothetical protein